MAYEEYNDLFIKAQENKSKYRLFTFDIIGSKKMNKTDRLIAQYDIRFLIERVFFDISELEKVLNKPILIKEPGFGSVFDVNVINDFAFRYEPFLFGDCIGLTIYNGSIEPQIVYDIFDMNKKELNLKFDFHKSNILYQTNDYSDGNVQYFRGYAINLSQNIHKLENYKLRKYLKDDFIVNNDIISNHMNVVKKHHECAIKNAIKLLSTNTNSFKAGIMYNDGRYIIKDSEVNTDYIKRLKLNN